MTRQTALLLANDRFRTSDAKTAHGLVRGPCRYALVGLVDGSCAGADAGELLDGTRRDIPVFASVSAALDALAEPPSVCVVGVAGAGGRLPDDVRRSLLEAVERGVSLVSGLHTLVGDDAEIAAAAARSGATITDLRRPRPASELRFFTGEILDVAAPRVAVLGTDCAVGKRTTCALLRAACRRRGVRAEMIYTGQTGWLSGIDHGLLLDATANDFVCGELEGAIIECQRELDPQVILIEGQSSLRNPTGPCGGELVISAAARGVILQHAPARTSYFGAERFVRVVPDVGKDKAMIELMGSELWAITVNAEGLDDAAAETARARLEREHGVPALLPLRDGVDALVDVLVQHGIGA